MTHLLRTRALARIRLLICLAAAVIPALSAPAAAAPTRAYAVIDANSGKLLKGRRSTERLHPASLTKMMTLYLVFEAVEAGALTLDQKLITSKHAASMPASKLGLKVGERITVRDAIRTSAVRSSNDAAVVLAEAVAGTEAAFARLMTERGRDLGLKATSFRNATGLTRAGHLSTPRDMARLALALHRDFPEYYGVFGREQVRVHNRLLHSTNRLLGAYEGADGVKTGYTRKAGFNLAAAATRDGKRVIAVYFGGRSAKSRDREVAELLDAGFELAPTPKPLRVAAPKRTPRPTPKPLELRLVAVALLTREPDETAAARTPPPAPEARPVAAPEPASGWSVQVGAYQDRAAAESRLRAVAAKQSRALAGASQTVLTSQIVNGATARTIFRARFVGFGESRARAACAELRNRGDDCAVVPPEGWRQAAN